MDTEIEQEIKERIERLTLVKHSLLSTAYRNRHHSVGINQLLNRLFALQQDHVVIVVLDKPKKAKTSYRVIMHTKLDPLWQKHFEQNVLIGEHSRIEGNHIYWSDSYAEKNKYQFHKTKWFAFFKPQYDSYPPKFRPFTDEKSGAEGSTLKEFAEHLKLAESKEFDALHLSKVLDDQFKRRADCWEPCEDTGFPHFNLRLLKKKKGDPAYLEDSDTSVSIDDLVKFKNISPIRHPWRVQYPIWPQGFIDACHNNATELFESLYGHFKNSPLLRQNVSDTGEKAVAANLIFSVRAFTSEEIRYRGESDKAHYRYKTYTFLPKDQKKELREGFVSLNREKLEKQKKLFGGYDAFFWELIENGQIDEILEEIEKPEGSTARTLSDRVFESGYVKVSYNPFGVGGNAKYRLDKGVFDAAQPQKEGQKQVVSDDYKRFVYHHYLSCVLSPDSKKPAILLVPVHIAGAPWLCISFFYDAAKHRKHQSFLDNFHFYSSIAHYIKQDISRRMRQAYLETLGDMYYYLILEFFGKRNRAKDLDKLLFEEIFNYYTKIIARIFPFRWLVIRPPNEDDIGKVFACWIEPKNGYFFKFSLFKNPYFTENIIGTFISEIDVINTLKVAGKRAFHKIEKP